MVVLGGSYLGLRVWIRSDINKICESVMSKYEGDKIEALLTALNSDSYTLKEKNSIIWALGYLNDQRALPVLKSLRTGNECDHEHHVCQRELNRAIDNIEGHNIVLLSFK